MKYNPQVFIRAAEIVANHEIYEPSDHRDHHMPGCWAIDKACCELNEDSTDHKSFLARYFLNTYHDSFGDFMFFDDMKDTRPQIKAQNHRVIALLLCAEICNAN